MSDPVTCRVCGDDVGRGPEGMELANHANKHRREFQEVFGREPEDYAEVREKLGPGNLASYHPDQHTIWEALTDDEQARLTEVLDE